MESYHSAGSQFAAGAAGSKITVPGGPPHQPPGHLLQTHLQALIILTIFRAQISAQIVRRREMGENT